MPGVRDAGAERKPRVPEGLLATAPSAASPGARVPQSPPDACKAPGGEGTLQIRHRPCQGERGPWADLTRTLKKTLLMMVGDWGGGLCARGLVAGLRERGWESQSSPTAGKESGTQGEEGREGLTLNSSGLRGHPTCLSAERAVGGSYLLRGPGSAVALVRREGRGLFHVEHVSPFPLSTLILVAFLSPTCASEKHYRCLVPQSGRDKLNFKGPGAPHFVCSTDPTRGPLPPFTPVPGPHPLRTLNNRSPATPPLCIQKSYSSWADTKPSECWFPHPHPPHTSNFYPMMAARKGRDQKVWL